MKLKKRILAGLMAASLIFGAMPGVSVNAATKLSYKDLYTKKITFEKNAVLPTPDASSAASSSAAITPDAASSGVSTDNGFGDPTSTAYGASTEFFEPEIQNETIKVMKGMQFVISTTRYGKLVATTKNSKNFKYKSSNKKIAKVDKNGKVTTLKNGKCDITITNKADSERFILHLNVLKNVKVKSIKLNAKEKNFKKTGKTFKLNATIKYSTKNTGDIPICWKSTDSNVAKVDAYGNVKIVGYGLAYITCTAGSNGKKASCKIKVVDPSNPSRGFESEGGTGGRPTYNTGKVVDISSHNVVSDWSKLRENADAVIIRIGYRGYGSGAIVQDSSFASNVYNAQQYGIPYAVYFYTTAVSEAEGREEADWIANRVGGMNLCFPVFIDTEYSNGNHDGRSDGLSQSARTAAVGGACSQLQGRGLEAGVYGSKWWLYNMVDMGSLPYNVWVAQYASSCDYAGSKLLWQYTSSAPGYGVKTGGRECCDVSYWYD
ncbi:GH25 family lysozyme [Butyrivibrio sp. WCD3002]|uniref:GH25 family lysozyme n=1 Tax=Butyrivibrio sp. WCD3002 TaxID=1280676 RepID=UPI0003FBB599|nr:GH25 family lysozyme [Butyrivibrio sp. WCD3002]